MSASEHAELVHLINLWNCTEPMTPAQIERMEELDARIRGMRVGLPKGEAVASEGRKYNDPKLSYRGGRHGCCAGEGGEGKAEEQQP